MSRLIRRMFDRVTDKVTKPTRVARPVRRAADVRARLLVQGLEDRLAPATFTVLNANDTGPGSLRQALTDAGNLAGADTIRFNGDPSQTLDTSAGSVNFFDAAPDTISLVTALPNILQSVAIVGPGADKLTVNHSPSAATGFRAFTFGLGVFAPVTATISGMTITGGHAVDAATTSQGARSGGGILAGSDTDMTLQNVVVTGNVADGGGGGVAVLAGGRLTVLNSTISGNSTGGNAVSGSRPGGGIYFGNAGTLVVDNSTISGNTSAGVGGGGIYMFGANYGAPARITVRNSVVSGNSTGGNGGGIELNIPSAGNVHSLQIQNSTIVNNTASGTSGGGGIAVVGAGGTATTTTIESSIVANNTSTAATSPDLFNPATAPVTVTFSLIKDVTGANLSGSSANNVAPGTDPALDATLHPTAGSPVINAGANAAAKGLDLGGAPRSVGQTDIGAFESPTTTAPTASAAAANVTVAGGTTGSVTVTYTAPAGQQIDNTTIGANDVTITGPAGPVTGITVTPPAASANSLTVTYTFTAPGGTWDGADYGTYRVAVNAGQVTTRPADGATPVAPAVVGGFRAVLAGTFVVLNTNDAGPGSLRQAVLDANARTDTVDTVRFNGDPALTLDTGAGSVNFFDATPDVITLTTGNIFIGEGVTVAGPGTAAAQKLTIQAASPTGAGQGRFNRHFFINTAVQQPVTLSGMTLTGGSTAEATNTARGGSIIFQDEVLNLVDSVVTGNTATTRDGGAISITNYGVLNLTRSVLSNNQALGATTAGDGGAINSQVAATLNITDSLISGNTGNGRGGAIYLGYFGQFTIVNSTISGNSAGASNGGGGLYFYGPTINTGVNTITNTTIANNVSNSSGGGIRTISMGGTTNINNSTITANTALGAVATPTAAGTGGGGISRSNSGAFILTSTIVSGNSVGGTLGAQTADIASGATPPNSFSGEFNAVGVDPGGTVLVGDWTSISHHNLPFGTALNLGPLQENPAGAGGTVHQPTVALLLGSPAINAGTLVAGVTPATDERGVGFPRVVGGLPDIGAYESPFAPPAAVVPALTNVTAANATATGINPYRFTVTYQDTQSTINVGTIDANDLTITPPAGVGPVGAISIVSTDATNNNSPSEAHPATVVVTYQFAPPGGTWDASDNGTYAINMAGTVSDANGLSVPAGVIGSFKVLFTQTFTVLNTNDSGAGSLRDALTKANAVLGTADTIVFNTNPANGTDFDDATPDTITLAGTALPVTDTVTVTGPGAGLLAVDGGNASRVFTIAGTGVITVTLSGLTVQGGNSTTGDGGGINLSDDNLTLIDAAVKNNFSNTEGGGIAIAPVGTTGGGNLVIRNTTISGNTSNGILGAAAGGAGGGVYFAAGGSLLMENSTVSGNTSNNGEGGGIYFYGVINAAGFTIRNSTISGNVAATRGGGVMFNTVTGTPVFQNSTLTLNVANNAPPPGGAPSGGGAIGSFGGSAVSLVSTIVAQNNGGTATDIVSDGPVTADHSLIGVGDSGFVLTDLGGTLSGFNNTSGPLDAMLGPLQDNGGPTFTHALLPGSPAIDHGKIPTGVTLTTDQRGAAFGRTFDDPAVANGTAGATDIGAYERRPFQVGIVQVNDGSAQRSEVRSITVTFTEPAAFAGGNAAAAFTLSRVGGGNVGLVATVAPDNRSVTLTWTGTAETDPVSAQNGGQRSLADGVYHLSIANGAVTSIATGLALDGDNNGTPGGAYTSPTDTSAGGPGQLRLFRLFGDGTGNGLVDLNDLSLFRGSFNSTGPNPPFLAFFDADNSNQIDLIDLSEFRQRFNINLLP